MTKGKRAEQEARFAAIARRESVPTPVRSRVWVLDDSGLEREEAREVLAEDCDVEVFADGAALLERLAQGDEPSVLLLDWQLPDMTGLEITRFVRTTWDEATLPILIMTATHPANGPVAALSAGANDFVTKPYDASALRARVKTLCRIRALHERARLAEEERAEAEERLARDAAFRERFIGILGHDLRSPLTTVVIGSASIVAAVEAAPARTAAQRIHRNARRMERMIADLLDFTRSRQDAGMPVELADMDMAAVVERAVQEARVAHAERTITFASSGDTRGRWDADRIEQIVSNLVTNAVAYSPHDTQVAVRVRRALGDVELEVTNLGPAIRPELLPLLFDPFRRAIEEGVTSAAARHGLGLGLYIVDQIARAHGGTAAVTSTTSEGTTVTVRLPMDGKPAI